MPRLPQFVTDETPVRKPVLRSYDPLRDWLTPEAYNDMLRAMIAFNPTIPPPKETPMNVQPLDLVAGHPDATMKMTVGEVNQLIVAINQVVLRVDDLQNDEALEDWAARAYVSMETHQAALAEIAALTATAGRNLTYAERRYTQAKANVARMRSLADEYERILDGPPKD